MSIVLLEIAPASGDGGGSLEAGHAMSPSVTNCVTGHWSAVTASHSGPGPVSWSRSSLRSPGYYSLFTPDTWDTGTRGHGDTGTRGHGTMWQDSGERGSELTLETGELELHVATASRSRAETRSRPERRAGQSTGTCEQTTQQMARKLDPAK